MACILSVATLLQPLSCMAQLLISIYFGDFCQADAGLSDVTSLSLSSLYASLPIVSLWVRPADGCPHCVVALQISIAAFNAFHLIGRLSLSVRSRLIERKILKLPVQFPQRNFAVSCI